MEYLGVMEYATKYKRHPNTVHRALKEGKIPGAVKNGGKWSIPEDAMIGGLPPEAPISTGVKAQVEPVDVGNSPPPDKQPSVEPEVVKDGIAEREDVVKLRESELLSVAAQMKSEQDEMDGDRQSLDSFESALQGWLVKANEKVDAVGELVEELSAGGYHRQVPIGGINYKTVPRFFDYTKAEIRDLLNRISLGLVGITELERPRFASVTNGDLHAGGEEQEPSHNKRAKGVQAEILKKVETVVDTELFNEEKSEEE